MKYVFFASWLMAAGSVDKVLDDWRATLMFTVAFAIFILCAVVLSQKEIKDDKRRKRTLPGKGRRHAAAGRRGRRCVRNSRRGRR